MEFLSEIGMAIYDETMAPGYARWRTVHPQLLDALVAYSGVRADSCVLELGCGTGNYIRALCERTGCAGWGLDPSTAMLAQARMGVLRRLHWVYAEAGRTSLADAQFHFTFCVDVVHHLDNRAGVFEEAHRVLRPSGALCLATDSENIIRSREPLSVYWPETVEAELARYPRIATLQAELREIGFVRLSQLEVASRSLLTDSGPYRAKVFSCLRSLPQEIYQQGLARLEADLVQGPVSFTSKYLLLWANKRAKW
jgi:ubiquinone/menaquinone biosynthesis C-methylase UbiE